MCQVGLPISLWDDSTTESDDFARNSGGEAMVVLGRFFLGRVQTKPLDSRLRFGSVVTSFLTTFARESRASRIHLDAAESDREIHATQWLLADLASICSTGLFDMASSKRQGVDGTYLL